MRTIIRFFEDSVEKYGDNVFLWEKTDGEYKGATYREVHHETERFAAGLLSLGIRKGDRLYTPEAKEITNNRNRETMKKLLGS